MVYCDECHIFCSVFSVFLLVTRVGKGFSVHSIQDMDLPHTFRKSGMGVGLIFFDFFLLFGRMVEGLLIYLFPFADKLYKEKKTGSNTKIMIRY